MKSSNHHPKAKNLVPLTLAAMGVVYGDIGTSPLYALRECFNGPHSLPVTDENIMGILSVILWSLIIIVSIKYLIFFMRADNRGEGGVLALLALAHPSMRTSKNDSRRYLIYLGLFGAALLFGDGMITPPVTVLGAMEGLEVATPLFKPYIVPLTIVILCLIFIPQRFGTGMIGRAFGPIIAVWFFTLGALGVYGISQNLEVLWAINPYYGFKYFINNGFGAFAHMGTVFLVVTGSEAMYADMGHFGKEPIRIGWFSLAFPGLALNYLGQGAFIINDHAAVFNPFFKLAPSWFLFPLVILAALAAIIASQALITGTFSVARQAIQLGYLPRLAINHTSEDEIGQIYVPFVNWTLLVATIWLVMFFQTSSNLAAAYGIAVSGTMVITTLMLFFVAQRKWGWPLWGALSFTIIFVLIDLTFLSANMLKISQGGWFPLFIGGLIFLCMTTWRSGRVLLAQRLKEKAMPLDKFILQNRENPPVRVPGTALFMTSINEDTPPALLHNLRHNKVMHERVILMTVETSDIPHVPRDERYKIETLDEDFYRIIVHYGFMDSPNVPAVLARCISNDLSFKLSEITYFLGRETLLATSRPGMALWREKLFAFMSRNAQRATTFFRIPASQVLEIGMQVEL